MFILLFLIIGLIPAFSLGQITSGPNNGCPGGNAIYQDIAIVYDNSYFPDNTSLDYSQQIATAIYSRLFVGPAYQLFDVYEKRVTQITPIPFPNTSKYNLFGYIYYYGTIRNQSAFKEVMDYQVSYASLSYFEHPSVSRISDALSFMIDYVQNGKRAAPVTNTIVIIAKRDTDVGASASYVSDLKSAGAKIMTIGVGNASVSNLASLSSGDGYNFLIPDITDNNVVDNVAQNISYTLLNDCGTTLAPPDYSTTSPGPTSPMTTPTTTTSSSTSTTSSTMPSSTSTVTTQSTASTTMSTSTETSTSTSTSTSTTSTSTSTTQTSTTPLTSTSSTVTVPSTTPITTVKTTTTRPTTTPTTRPSTTPPNPCQSGGTFINQDIALIYDVSTTSDTVTDSQMPTFISTTLFSPSAYSFDYFHPIPVPFPRTAEFATANGIPSAFSNINTLQHYQVTVNTQTALSSYFNSTQSIVNDALTFLVANPLRRRPNIPQNFIIVAKNANQIDQSTINNAQTLKNSGMTIITIGIGNTDFSNLFNLATSNDYTFSITDLSDSTSVSDVTNSVATKLVNLCATNFL